MTSAPARARGRDDVDRRRAAIRIAERQVRDERGALLGGGARERGAQARVTALAPRGARDRHHVLVAAARQADDDDAVADRARDLVERGDRVRGLERAQDALGAREPLERGERLVVGARRGSVAAPGLLPVRVLGPDARIVEAGADRVRVRDLAVRRRQHVALAAVQHADAAGAERRGVAAGRDALARRLDAEQLHAARRRRTARTGPPRSSRRRRTRRSASGSRPVAREDLRARLAADHRSADRARATDTGAGRRPSRSDSTCRRRW